MKSLFNFRRFIKDDSALEWRSPRNETVCIVYAQMRVDDKKLDSISWAIFPRSAMTYVC